MPMVYNLVSWLFELYILAIFVRAILSWFNLDPRHPVVTVLRRITEPVLAPIRSITGNWGAVDFSPMIAILLLIVIRRVLLSLLATL